MAILKLTIADKNARPIFVNTDQILYMYTKEKEMSTHIQFGSATNYSVKESPEQIIELIKEAKG